MSVWPRSHQATVNTLGPPAAAVSPPHLIGHNPLHVDQSDVMGVAVLQFISKSLEKEHGRCNLDTDLTCRYNPQW